MVRISNKDIIKILIENSRTPYVEIAKRLGVSEAAIRKRVKKLEKEGIIKFTVEINPKILGYQVIALIGLDTLPNKYIDVIEKLKEKKEVKNLYSSTGDHMIMLEAWFKDSKELINFVRELENLEGVTKVCPAILLDKIK